MLLTILAFVFVLGIVVFFHELGHFIVAKLSGVKVERFSLGFPPKLVGFKWGETEYCISWIPLGGYVKMTGENPEEAEKLGNAPGSLGAQPSLIKALIFASGPLANYLTALLIAAGLFYFMGKEIVDEKKVIVGAVEKDLPAYQAGLQPGDIIRTMGGTPIVTLDDLHNVVFSRPGATLNLVWERRGRLDSSQITIASDSSINLKGEEFAYGRIGIRQQSDTLSVGAFEAIGMGTQATWNMSVVMVSFLKKLITGEASRKLLGGPISIAKYSGQKAREGVASLLDFIVIISINLAILNLLPIPILDGGHLFLLLVEVIRRKPLTLKQKAVFQQVGLAFLMVLIIFVTYNDIFVNWAK